LKPRTQIITTVVVVVTVAALIFAYFNYGSGVLEIKLTDPPQEWGVATQIYLKHSSIEIHRAQAGDESGWLTVVDKNAWINLTKTLDVNETISIRNLQAGHYNHIRFSILEALVTINGKNHTATVPSGELKITITKGGIQINTSQTATLLIELNVKIEGTKEAGLRIVPAMRATPV